MRRDARRAPAARAAVVTATATATALAAVAASVLLGLGYAQANAQVTAPDLRAAPGVEPARPPLDDRARPEQRSTDDSDDDFGDSEQEEDEDSGRDDAEESGTARGVTAREAPERLPAGAPQATPRSAEPPAETDESRPTGRTAGPVGDGGPPRVADTPCTATARACVALDQRQAWLLDAGNVVRGPVPMQHGDVQDPTPRGTFKVQWKAEEYTSREYLTQMPYSVFFADGGIAFHQGAQDRPSAGCVKLGREDAEAFFYFLQVGDEVQIH